MIRILCAIAVACALSCSAHALDFSQPVLDIDGNPLKEADKVITIGQVATSALLASFQDETALPGDAKVKRFLLALKIKQAKGDIQLTIDETKMVKDLVAKLFNPLVTGRMWQMLDPASVK